MNTITPTVNTKVGFFGVGIFYTHFKPCVYLPTNVNFFANSRLPNVIASTGHVEDIAIDAAPELYGRPIKPAKRGGGVLVRNGGSASTTTTGLSSVSIARLVYTY